MSLCWRVIVSLLPQGALQNSYCAAPPGSIVGHASSGQFLGSLLSDHSAQRAVADGAVVSAVEYYDLTTALVRLYFAGTSREKRYYALLALYS